MSIIVEVDDNGNIVIPQSIFGKKMNNIAYEVEQNGNTLTVVPVDNDISKLSIDEWTKRFEDWIASVPDKGKIDPNATFSRDELYD